MTVVRVAFFFLLSAAFVRAEAPLLDFPTENRSILTGSPQEFYMYVQRDFEGEKSLPWQGGQYGFVRTPRRDSGEIVFTQLHEGVDIKPMRRDAAGNPLDPILAAADGKVVHASKAAGASNYGRYVVIEHRQDGAIFYTLYAHLSTIAVEPGQSVRQGQQIGVMGFTGNGIDRERSHLHFEVCLMLNENFDAWHHHHFPSNPNQHGLYNGLNLAGSDPSKILLEARKNPALKITDFFTSGEPWYKIAVKNSPGFSLLRTAPWLVPAGEVANPPAWIISFSRQGVPLKIVASETPVTQPTLVWIKPSSMSYAHATRGLISGASGSPRLTESGLRHVRLLIWPE